MAIVTAVPATAEGEWKPFAERDAAAAKRRQQETAPLRPLLSPFGDPSATPAISDNRDVDGQRQPSRLEGLPPLAVTATTVERGELAPVMAADGSDLPLELWRGLDIAGVEALFARLDMPPRSAAVNGLWRRLLQADAPPPGGSGSKFQALRTEAYRRSGLLQEQSDALAKAIAAGSGLRAGPGAGTGSDVDAVLAVLQARADIAGGQMDTGCAATKSATMRKAELPKRLQGDMIILAGFCAAHAGNAAGAGLAVELAREEGHEASTMLAALEAIALGPELARTQLIALPKRIDALDYRFLMQTAAHDAGPVLDRADPSALALIVALPGTDPKVRLVAAEAAARSNVIAAERLAEVYRVPVFQPAELADPMNSRVDPLLRRALLLQAAEAERTPQRRTRVLRALLDDARRGGLYLPMLRIAAKPVAALARQVEIGWFAETAVEAMVAAERYDEARSWAAFGQTVDAPASGLGGRTAGFQHWLALIDIADPANQGPRGQGLASVEQMALAGRFSPEQLHRLATILDALDYQVPIPLWDAASRTPQPSTGHLPETGVLSELQDAAKKKEFGRTVLLTLRTLGPGGAEGAHMIALGDAIRALKRAGLEADARRLGFEALFAAWPRSAG